MTQHETRRTIQFRRDQEKKPWSNFAHVNPCMVRMGIGSMLKSLLEAALEGELDSHLDEDERESRQP